MKRIMTLLAFAFVALSAMALAADLQPVDRDTKCGEPATGRRQDNGLPVTLDRASAALLRVGPDGYWRWCEATVEPKREPAACVVPRMVTWAASGNACRSYMGGQTVAHGRYSQALQATGMDGLVVLQCTDGELSVRVATCNAIARCEGQHTITEDGGKTLWRWAGSMAIGARDVAISDDGDTRPVECQANGTMRLL